MPKMCESHFNPAAMDIAAYMKYYNYQRGHSYSNYQSPAVAEAA
jgi:hypothetical protein